MGWKKLKEHYKIGHIVQVTSKGVCIGSPYIHDFIVIANGTPKWSNPRRVSSNDDLARYFAEMNSDLSKLQELIDAPDEFENSITVYSYDGATIIEKKCEKLGWPNITHDGEIMHDNLFSEDHDVTLKRALEYAQSGVKHFGDRVAKIQEDLKNQKKLFQESQYQVASLEKEIAEST